MTAMATETGDNGEMAAMDDLIAFLRAREAERERAAKAMKRVYPTPWDVADRGWMARVTADEPHFHEVIRLVQHQAPDESDWLGGVVEHVALNNPDFVLADVEAKRRIVGLHAIRSGTGGDTDPPAICNEDNDLHPCETLRCLALPYAAHPDYIEEWRP